MVLEEIFQRVTRECGVVLLEHHISGDDMSPRIKLVVDTESGITIGEITDVTKRLKNSFDMKQLFPRGFHLEVTSPGLEYPLKRVYQFRRNLNRSMRVFHKDTDVPNPVEGILRDIEDDRITIQTNKGDYILSLKNILEGKLISISKDLLMKRRKD